jgi:Golgi nucleoside diphosphatase
MCFKTYIILTIDHMCFKTSIILTIDHMCFKTSITLTIDHMCFKTSIILTIDHMCFKTSIILTIDHMCFKTETTATDFIHDILYISFNEINKMNWEWFHSCLYTHTSYLQCTYGNVEKHLKCITKF